MGGGNDTAWGTATANTLLMGAGNDVAFGYGGNDTLTGGAGADSLQGGDGDDRIVIDAADTWFSGDAGIDTLVDTSTTGRQYALDQGAFENVEMGVGNDTAWGNAAANSLSMGSGNDTAFGYGGNDTITGGAGADSLQGGDGDDRIIIDAADTWFSGDAGTDTLVDTSTAGRQYSLDQGAFENAEMGAGNDTVWGNAAANSLLMGAGNDIAYGYDGNDILNGGAGTDTLIGGLGDDAYYVDLGADSVTEAATSGTDTIYSSVTLINRANVERLTLTGALAINATGLDAWADTITGNSAANTLTGLGGNDSLNGGAGADTMIGGLGDDTYYVDVATDIVTELATAGTDTISSSVTLTNRANIERLVLSGTAAINATGLDAWADGLTGNTAANVLSGLGGNDVLDGGLGNDTLTGGAGSDLFRFSLALSATANLDTITDFSHAVDDLQLSKAIFAAIGTGLDATELRSGSAATDANDYLVYNGATGQLFYDADGSGSVGQILFAKLTAGTVLDAGDFVLV